MPAGHVGLRWTVGVESGGAIIYGHVCDRECGGGGLLLG